MWGGGGKRERERETMHDFENKASFTFGEERDKLHSQDRDGKLKV